MKRQLTAQRHVDLPRTALRVQLVRRQPPSRKHSRLQAANRPRPLLIDNYDSYTYNLYQIIAEVYGVAPLVLYNDSADIGDIQQLLERDEVHHIILSPGPGSPDTAADIGVCLDILHSCTSTPVLGVCLGHQALAAAAGGAVIRAPEPVHGRLSSIRHTGHQLFAGCPSGPASGFEVVRYHSLIVDSSSLPDELEPLAWSTGQHRPVALQDTLVEVQHQPQQQLARRHAAAELPAKPLQQQQQQHLQEELIMALRHRQRPHYGVQFHPESIATRYGIQVVMNFRGIAYQHTGHDVPHDLTANLFLRPAGPPGRAWAPRTWPTQQQQQTAVVQPAGLPQTAADDHLLSSLAPAAKLGSSSGRLVPAGLELSWLKLPGVLSAAGGSQLLFEQLVGPGPDTFWLDSASAPERARFSYMGGGQVSGPLACRVMYKLPQPHTQAAAAPGLLTINSSKQQQQRCHVSIWDYLQHQLQELQLLPSCAAAAATQLPFNFWGGFVGYLGYELKAECGGSSAHAAEEPDAAWLFADRAIVCDHDTDDVYLLALHQPAAAAAVGTEGAASDAAAAQQWLADTADAVQQLADVQGQAWPISSTLPQGQRQLRAQQQLQRCRLRHNQAEYVANVCACQAALIAGESYELCLTTAYQLQQAPQPWQYYQTLRKTNPAPYAAWLHIGAGGSSSSSNGGLHAAGSSSSSTTTNGNGAQHTAGNSSSSSSGVVICCSSPERFLQGGRGGVLEAKPIKGTAARHLDDPAADAAAAAALISSEKERAENLMIVDLLRNDLGKVCEPGSVHVPGLIQLESYASVHQLVSTVRGLRKAGTSCIDAIRAAFPGGSMTGAPKIRSMSILDDLEGAARGVYSGALGYLSVNDTFDLNIVIRTAVFKQAGQQDSSASLNGNRYGSNGGSRYGSSSSSNGYVMSVGAGGAVVVQSDPVAEFAEMQLKAKRLLQTAALVQQQQQQGSMSCSLSGATPDRVRDVVAK